jgi:16S rRNA (cytosine1402-N4)-methyltransferase
VTDEPLESSDAQSPQFSHTPVMVDEVMELLAPRAGEVAVDCTVGLGGHAAPLSDALGPSGAVVGLDLDAAALARAEQALAARPARFVPINAGFDSAPSQLEKLSLRANMLLADLGFGSHQMDDPARGFSFSAEGPLDMRFNREQGSTAADLLGRLSERDLADLIYKYGEEPFSRRIARKLVDARRQQPIRSTAQLARLVEEAYGRRASRSRRHPATRTFMALRIAVNDELEALHALLDAIATAAERVGRGEEGVWLEAGARVVFISFHSLEDRLVKHAFADLAKNGLARKLTRKPLTASEVECERNPRARSAKLRAIEIGTSRSGTDA